MSATGASAAIAGAIGVSGITAGVVSAVASVAFQVTGVNDKINKAASKVFGEDLVGFANIAGAVYGAVNGGFDIGKGGELASGAGEALSKAALDGTTDLGFNSAAGAYDVATGSTNTLNGLPLAGEALSKATLDGTNAFGSNSSGDYFNLADQAGIVDAAAPTVEQGTNVMNQSAPLNTDSKVAEMSRSSGATAPDAAANKNAVSTAPNASALNAAGQSAAGQSAAGSGLGLRLPNAGSGLGVRLPNNALVPQESGNVFTRMLGGLSEKERLGLLQGAGTAVTGYMTSREAAKKSAAEMAWAKERYYNSAPSVRVVG